MVNPNLNHRFRYDQSTINNKFAINYLWGTWEIGGVYGRYLPGYWGIWDPIIIILLEVEGKALFRY